MNEIIPINNSTIAEMYVPTVNARDLHEFLENKDKFATWIKDRIDQFDFVENQDFVTYSENPEKGRPRVEYSLTLDMGKELSMVERNSKGKLARQYFIECERKVKAAPALPSDPIMAMVNVVAQLRSVQLALESGQQVLAVGLSENRHAVAELKSTMRIENWQQCNIKEAVNHKIAEFRELYPSAETAALYRKTWRYIKDKFQVPRYSELPAMMYDEVLRTVHSMAMHNLAGL